MNFTFDVDGVALVLNRDEVGHLNNALNEIYNGFTVANFEAAIGLSTEDAAKLLHRISRLPSDAPLRPSLPELDALRNSLTAVLAELESSEYATRMGFEVQESEWLRNRLDDVASEARYRALRQTA